MKNACFLFCLVFLLTQLTFGQSTSENKKTQLKFVVKTGLLNTAPIVKPYFWTLCGTDCAPERQRPKASARLDFGLAIVFNHKHELNFLFGYAENGYREVYDKTLEYRERDVSWPFIGMEISHIRVLMQGGNMDLFFGNGLRFEIPQNDKWEVIRPLNLSYTGRFGVSFKVADQFSFQANALFKSAILRYNKEDESRFHKNYFPYGFGLEIGFKAGAGTSSY